MIAVKRNSGFTLIELLVVIAIIGIIASVVMAQISVSQVNTRDAERLSEVRNTVIALNLYLNEYDSFPCVWYQDSVNSQWFLSFLQDTNMFPSGYFPRDPINDENYFYEFWTSKASAGAPCGQVGIIGYSLEGENIICIGNRGQGPPPWDHHCHVVIPGPVNCSDPYMEEASMPSDCYFLRP